MMAGGAEDEKYAGLVARVGVLEAELAEVKGTLTKLLSLISDGSTAQLRVTRLGDVATGPSPLLELPVEILQKILYFLDDTALYYASKTCTAMYNVSGCNLIWQDKFAAKWPAFYDTFRNEQRQRERESGGGRIAVEEGTYKRLFKDTNLGRRSWEVQVYKRDLNEGFRASFADATVKLDPFSLTYLATYRNSGPHSTSIERGVAWSRIRSVADEIWGINPYDVWNNTPLEELKEGIEVEVQWAPTTQVAFSWWYGVLEAIEDEPDHPDKKWITFKFYQYPEDSFWASGEVLYPNLDKEGEARGIYGGIRPIKRPQDLDFWHKRRQLGDW